MMSRWFLRGALGVLAVMLCGPPTPAAGDPAYLILRAPAAPASHPPTAVRHPLTVIPVESSSYSYGWFGASARRHWSRHFGYYRNYTEWSAR
jgi:hypothetical protein